MYSLCMMASKTLTGCNSSPERTVWFLGGVLLYLRPSQIWIWSSVITSMIHTFRSTVLWHAFRVHWKNSEGGLCIWLLTAYKTLVSVRYKGDTYFWYIFDTYLAHPCHGRFSSTLSMDWDQGPLPPFFLFLTEDILIFRNGRECPPSPQELQIVIYTYVNIFTVYNMNWLTNLDALISFGNKWDKVKTFQG